MKARDRVLDWAAQGRIQTQDTERALRLAGALSAPADWRRFLDRLFLWLGVLMLAAALIFFFAYNWVALGRYARFAIAEAALLVAVAAAWKLGLESVAGKAALFAAALLVGALLALVGQTYQTGADPWQLFAVWAAAILPWCLIGRLPALWLFWLALLNLAGLTYYYAFGSVFGWFFDEYSAMWAQFGLNVAALVLWEIVTPRFEWMHGRWPRRLIATAIAMVLLGLVIWALFEWRPPRAAALFAWLALSAACFYRYRRVEIDLYLLALGALTGIIVIAAAMSKLLFDTFDGEAGGALLIGLTVIGLSTAAARWLAGVARERRA